jgi:hypothetical protein
MQYSKFLLVATHINYIVRCNVLLCCFVFYTYTENSLLTTIKYRLSCYYFADSICYAFILYLRHFYWVGSEKEKDIFVISTAFVVLVPYRCIVIPIRVRYKIQTRYLNYFLSKDVVFSNKRSFTF